MIQAAERRDLDLVPVVNVKSPVAPASGRVSFVRVKGIARSPGFRSKVAVTSLDEKVDPVGACVGYRKSRIENIIKELSGEKVDIVQWSKDPQVFIARRITQVCQDG